MPRNHSHPSSQLSDPPADDDNDSNMPSTSQDRPPSQASGEGIEEVDGLLTGQDTGKQSSSSHTNSAAAKHRWRELGLFVWALLATAAVVVGAVVWQHSSIPQAHQGGKSGGAAPHGKRNLIFMVSDGMGPTSLALTRSWRQYTDNLAWNQTLVLDDYLIGQSRTRSTSSLVTDSAAGATAFSCGAKSYNGAISVLPDSHLPCGSVMEAAKRLGYTTGLVVTTRITDATPAVFAAHVRRREMEDAIALQMVGATHPLGRMVDLMMGGGRAKFLPAGVEGGGRVDGLDVLALAQEEKLGWRYIGSKAEFDGLGAAPDLPLLALFAPGDIPYEVDRRFQEDVYPSLEEMTRTALRALAAATKDSEQGFFVMIEGSRIDHAGHANDPAAQVHEVLAYDRALSAVLEFIEDEDTPTLLVATSDHETGGLATARQIEEAYPEYLWYPSVLANATHSASWTAGEYHAHLTSLPSSEMNSSTHTAIDTPDLRSYLTSLAASALGISSPTAAEVDLLISRPAIAAYTFANMLSLRAQTGWSTHGHSGADVNIYASDPFLAQSLRGNRENTDVGAFLRSYLDADAEVLRVTAALRAHGEGKGEAWLGIKPEEGERLDGQSHLETGGHGHVTRGRAAHVGDHHARPARGEEGCEVCGWV